MHDFARLPASIRLGYWLQFLAVDGSGRPILPALPVTSSPLQRPAAPLPINRAFTSLSLKHPFDAMLPDAMLPDARLPDARLQAQHFPALVGSPQGSPTEDGLFQHGGRAGPWSRVGVFWPITGSTVSSFDDIHHAQALANGTSWGALRFSRDQGQGLRSNLSSQLEFSSARSRQRRLAADKSRKALVGHH